MQASGARCRAAVLVFTLPLRVTGLSPCAGKQQHKHPHTQTHAPPTRRCPIKYKLPLGENPSSTPAPPTPLSKRTCDALTNAKSALTNAKSARRATSSSPSPSVRQGWGAGTATHDTGGLGRAFRKQGGSCFPGKPWLRPRGPKYADVVARQRRCPVVFKPPRKKTGWDLFFFSIQQQSE
jgi:hypothetical protein